MAERKKRIKDSNNRRSKAIFKLYRYTERSLELALSVRSSRPTPETHAEVDKIKIARNLVQHLKQDESLTVPLVWQEFFNGDETKPEYPYAVITRLSQDTIDEEHAQRTAATKQRIASKIAEGLALLGIKD